MKLSFLRNAQENGRRTTKEAPYENTRYTAGGTGFCPLHYDIKI